MSDHDRHALAALLTAALPGWTWDVRSGTPWAVAGTHPDVRGGRPSIGVGTDRRAQGACGVVVAHTGRGWREKLVAGVVAGVEKADQ